MFTNPTKQIEIHGPFVRSWPAGDKGITNQDQWVNCSGIKTVYFDKNCVFISTDGDIHYAIAETPDELAAEIEMHSFLTVLAGG